MTYTETIPETVWDWKESGSPEIAQESIALRLRQIQRKRAVEEIEEKNIKK